MNEKQMLLNRLQVCDFVLTETGLFLDTHPKDRDALAHYQKYLTLKKETLAEYTQKYGTINRDHLHGDSKWDWVENPWPWENSEV